MKTIHPETQHQALLTDMKEVLKKHCADIPASVVLAIAAQLVGQLLAVQDQRAGTVADYMDMINCNIAIGNAAVLRPVMDSANTLPV